MAGYVPPDAVLLPVPSGTAIAEVTAFVDTPALQAIVLDGRPRGPPLGA
jgi:hypothetical protein